MILRWRKLLIGVICFTAIQSVITDEKNGQPFSKGTAHFTDLKNGYITWTLGEQSLPWRGTYSFLAQTSSSAAVVLLTIADNSAGVKLAECRHLIKADKPEVVNVWKKVQWELSSSSLTCEISADDVTIDNSTNTLFLSGSSPLLSARISAVDGVHCIKSFSVSSERLPETCPPRLKQNCSQAQNFECGCPLLKFGTNVRRKPVPSSPEPKSAVPNENEKSKSVDEIPNASEEALLDSAGDGGNVPFPIFQLATSGESGKSAKPEGKVQSDNTTTEAVGDSGTATTAHPCAQHECLHEGTCVVGNDSQPTCLCSEGFNGTKCEIDLCSLIECKNGGSCVIRNGRATCSCPPGTTGELCHEVVCSPPCSNNGTCVVSQQGALCKCTAPFLGSNCNILDVCSDDATCAAYKEFSAKCLIDANSLASKFSEKLVNASYACLCKNENEEYVDCSELESEAPVPPPLKNTDAGMDAIPSFHSQPHQTLHPEQANNSSLILGSLPVPRGPPGTVDDMSVTNETDHLSQTATTMVPSTHASGLTDVLDVAFNQTSDATLDPHASQEEVVTTTGFPQHQFNGAVSSGKSTDTTMETSSEDAPAFPLITNMPIGKVDSSQSTDVAQPGAGGTSAQAAEFTRLPALPTRLSVSEEVVTEETPTATASIVIEKNKMDTTQVDLHEESTTFPPDETEDEMGGDNGFERITQIVEVPTSHRVPIEHFPTDGATSSIEEHTLPTKEPYPTSASVESNKVEEHEQVEEHTLSATTTLRSEHAGNSVDEDHLAAGSISSPTHTNRTIAVNKSSALSWIIGIAVLLLLFIMTTVGGLFVARYLRRSRRLHGKYNPAREENAVVSSYSMPMTSVGKEERLI